MNADETFAALERYDGSLPRAALRSAAECREAIVPMLLREVKCATDDLGRIRDDANYMRHVYALYLLAQFRETKAFPPIVELFSLPGDVVDEVFGDLVTEDLGRILASTFDGGTARLEKMIESDGVYTYARSAALQAFVILWGRGRLTRREVIGYFRSLMSGKLTEEASPIWGSLVVHSLDLGPDELETDLRGVFDRGLVEPFHVDRRDLEASLGRAEEEVLEELGRDRHSSLIDDTAEELESWAAFRPPVDRPPSVIERRWSSARPYVNEKREVGRNDPCPCGSGKKYKKCCLRSERA